jgi:hypothetical protein
MRISKSLVLAGVAALALAGGPGLAVAQPLHSMIVRLPDGGFAQIQYSGNVSPKVTFAPGPLAAPYYHPASPFAMFDRISAQIDRDMDALMSDVVMRPPLLLNPDRMFDVDLHNLAPGATQYSVISTMAGDGSYCTRSVEITRAAPGARPHIVTHMSGDCRGTGEVRFGAEPLAPRYRVAPPIETRTWRGGRRSGPTPLEVAYRRAP